MYCFITFYIDEDIKIMFHKYNIGTINNIITVEMGVLIIFIINYII